MTAAVLVFVLCLWPLVAFAGGLGFTALTTLVGVVSIPSLGRLRPRLYVAPLLAFFLFAAVSTLWSPRAEELVEINFQTGDFHVRSEVIRVGLLFVALAAGAAASMRLQQKRARLVSNVARVALGLNVIIAFLVVVFLDQALELFAGLVKEPGDAILDTARNCQIMAIGLTWLVPSLLQFEKRAVGIGLAGGALTLALYTLIANDILAGVFAIAAAGGATAVIRIAPINGFRIIGGGLAAVVLAMPLLAGWISQGRQLETATNSLEWRQAIWARVLEIVAAHPVFGGGVGVLRTIHEVAQEGVFTGQNVVPNHAHNMFLQVWAETGAVGALLVAATLVLAAWRMPAPQRLGASAIQVAGLVGGASAISLVSYDLWHEWWWGAVGLLSLLCVTTYKKTQYEP